MPKSVLIAYASRSGSTEEVAREIGDILKKAGIEAAVLPVKRVWDVGDYGAVVIGSAVYAGRWLSEARKFLRRFQPTLARMRVAAFSMGVSTREGEEAKREELLGSMDPLREITTPVSVAPFAGKMDRKKLPFFYRLLIKLLKVPDGDFRDWDAIREWARGLPLALFKSEGSRGRV